METPVQKKKQKFVLAHKKKKKMWTVKYENPFFFLKKSGPNFFLFFPEKNALFKTGKQQPPPQKDERNHFLYLIIYYRGKNYRHLINGGGTGWNYKIFFFKVPNYAFWPKPTHVPGCRQEFLLKNKTPKKKRQILKKINFLDSSAFEDAEECGRRLRNGQWTK